MINYVDQCVQSTYRHYKIWSQSNKVHLTSQADLKLPKPALIAPRDHYCELESDIEHYSISKAFIKWSDCRKKFEMVSFCWLFMITIIDCRISWTGKGRYFFLLGLVPKGCQTTLLLSLRLPSVYLFICLDPFTRAYLSNGYNSRGDDSLFYLKLHCLAIFIFTSSFCDNTLFARHLRYLPSDFTV